MTDEEKTWMITELEKYKSSLENREIYLQKELSKYQKKSSISDKDRIIDDSGEYDICNDPYETYLLAQIKMLKVLPALLEAHIICIENGDDLDQVLVSLEFEIYKVKKKIYVNIPEWEDLLNHLSDQRLLEIGKNPKGPGDLIIKELCWIKNYEDKWK